MNHTVVPKMEAIEFGKLIDPPHGSMNLTAEVDTADWTHVCPCRFGLPRAVSWSTGTKWTGDSFRYDIFSKKNVGGLAHGRFTFALRWQNGGGTGWLVSYTNNTKPMLESFSDIPNEESRWDMCHALWEAIDKTAQAARAHEANVYATAFVDGRLKKRKIKTKSGAKQDAKVWIEGVTAWSKQEVHVTETMPVGKR